MRRQGAEHTFVCVALRLGLKGCICNVQGMNVDPGHLILMSGAGAILDFIFW